MGLKESDRVVFYSNEDRSSGYNLKMAEELLKNIDLSAEFDLNDLLEFYNIKLYFDNSIFLLNWSDLVKNSFREIIDKTWELNRIFWLKINDDNIIANIEILEFGYNNSFWQLVNYFQVYTRIDKKIFSAIANNFSHQITYILEIKNIVDHFDQEIKAFLVGFNQSAELLLSKIEKTTSNSPIYFFPKSLNDSDKESIISKYLDNEDANLNFVRLIENSKDTDLRLSPKIRLKAKRKAIELNSRIFEEGFSWKVGVQITISKDQDIPVKFSNKEHILEVSYSANFLDQQIDNYSLFQLFITLFEFTDKTGLITLVNKENELDVLEKTFMRSINEYLTGSVFTKKEYLSHLQILIFNHYLKQRNNSIEELTVSFIYDFLNPYFKLTNLQFRFPTKNATYLEKIRVLAPEFEFLLKQYHFFVNEGNIDFELLALSSYPLHFSNILSLVDKKYIYTNSDIILHLKYNFFSDHSGLYHLDLYKNKYRNLYDLLVNENVKLEDFHNYQKARINKLIEDNYLCIEGNGYIKIKKDILIFILGIIHRNEVLSYWHYPEIIRTVIDEMINDNLLYFENTLFTKQELNYFNFYLNKKEFTNGLDLRNKYLHGTNTGSEKEHENEYHILLRLIILALLKIEDDLMLDKKVKMNSC